MYCHWKNGPEKNGPGTNFFNENFGPGTEIFRKNWSPPEIISPARQKDVSGPGAYVGQPRVLSTSYYDIQIRTYPCTGMQSHNIQEL